MFHLYVQAYMYRRHPNTSSWCLTKLIDGLDSCIWSDSEESVVGFNIYTKTSIHSQINGLNPY